MKLIVCKNYEEASAVAADIFAETLREKPEAILGLATGSTPEGMYARLSEMHEKEGLDFSKAKSYNLDEYYPISPDNRQSYRYFMEKHLFSKVNFKAGATHVLDGTASDAEAECRRYEAEIDEAGGIDLQILGIGENGHIAFNEPGDYLHAETHKTGLTESTIKANARFFSVGELMPNAALTVGMGVIMRAKKVLLIATGAKKKAAIKELLSGRISTACPASVLQMHPNAVIICDEAAMEE